MVDARTYWENRHTKRHHLYRDEPSRFARLCVEAAMEAGIEEGYHMLDVGCGVASDGVFFAKQGLQVLGMDFSMFSLQLAQRRFQRHKVKPLGLVQANIGDGLPFAALSFDVLYANLSLHYFDDVTLDGVLDDIYRILYPSGLVVISVRSTDDPKYGVGEQISERAFNADGCIRYFFDADYLEQKLRRFQIVQLFPFRPEFEAELLVAIAIKKA